MKFQEMYIIVFGIVILKLQISVSDPQFPRHIDLQKVGEAIFNNEKFNILKPTAHLVTDHFKDFMLKQKNGHPGDRVFIDKNGFRHAWSDFGDKTKSLRKTDIKSRLKHISASFENVLEKTTDFGVISIDGSDNDNPTATAEDSNENENSNQEEENNASGSNETVQNVTKEDTEPPDSKETTTRMNIPLDAHEMNSTEIKIQQKTSDKNKTGNKVGGRKGHAEAKGATTATPKGQKPRSTLRVAKPNDNQPIEKERTVATTTFFCPFFGVITMSSFID